MQQKEKQEFISIIRTEVQELLKPLEDRLNSSVEKIVNRKFGVFIEVMNDKFTLVTERFDAIDKNLDKHTEMFKDIYKKLDTKADVKEFDAFERRVIKLEEKMPRPSRSG